MKKDGFPGWLDDFQAAQLKFISQAENNHVG
jgi:hypothetical protein